MVLVIVGAVTLVIGVFAGDDNLTLVYASIAACVLAGIFLIVGIVRQRPSKKPVLSSGGQGSEASWSGASAWSGAGESAPSGSSPQTSTAVLEREESAEPAGSRVQVVTAEEAAADAEGGQTGRTGAARAAARAGSAEWASDEDETEIVVVPKRTSGAARSTAASGQTAPVVRKVSAGTATAKKAAAKKTTARKSTAKKAAGRATSAQKSTAKKSTAKKSTAKKAAPSRKAAAPRTPAKKAAGGGDFDTLLADVPGIGPAKRRQIAEHFGTVRKLRSASVEQLTEVDGVSETLAERIRDAVS